MHYKKVAIGLALCLSIWVTSCAAYIPSEPTSDSESASNSFSSEETSDKSFPILTSVTDANLKTIVGSSSESGFYEIKSVQAEHYIYYTDYSSQQQVILCPIPNCQHNDSSCPGFLPSDSVDYAGIFVCGNKLVLSSSAPSHQIPVALYSMDLDGSNKKLLHQFSASENPQDPVLFDGQAIYYVLSKVTYATDGKSPTYSSSLYKLDLLSGKNDEILLLSSQDSIIGTVGGNIVLKSIISNQYNLYVVSPDGKKKLLDFTWSTNYPYYVTDNEIYIMSDDLDIQCYNYLDKEVSTIFLPDELHSAKGITFDGFWDEKLFFIVFESDNSIKEIAVDVTSNEAKDISLCGLDSSGQRKRPICIAAEFADSFLVETGTIDDSQSQRALISKDDFWAGNPNYNYIKNDF